jgi:hypothetical protein
MIGWQGAEAVALDLQCAIEARAEILERDCLSQFDHLLIAELRADFGEHLIGNLRRRTGHSLGIAQQRFFPPIEARTRLEISERFELLVGDARVSARGRVNVDSERTSDHLSGAHESEGLEAAVHHGGCGNRLIQPT